MEKIKEIVLSDKTKRAAIRALRTAIAIIVPVIIGQLLEIPELLWAAPILVGIDKYIRDSK